MTMTTSLPMEAFAVILRFRISFGILLFFILSAILLTIAVWLIERNYHEDSESRVFLFGFLVGTLGLIGGVIGQATGGISDLVGYYYNLQQDF